MVSLARRRRGLRDGCETAWDPRVDVLLTRSCGCGHEARASSYLSRARYEAVPRVTYRDPQAASVGDAEGSFTATVALAGIPRTSTYTRAYDTQPGFLTLVSDGARLTGAYALGPEAGEWLQQVTLAIRAGTPLAVLLDVIPPFPTFSEAVFQALRALDAQVNPARPAAVAASTG